MEKDYKSTLLMPKTNFEMRGNLPQKDLFFINKNINTNLIQNLKTRKGHEFILHDGPPYANGNIHLGHALNKILKDIITRREVLKGSKLNLIPGWDTFGLPIENEIQKKGILLKEVGEKEYLRKCFNYAKEQVERQEKQFKKLNLLFDFENKYLTLDYSYVKNEIKIFHQMLNQGLIYRSLKPIYWSYSSNTALADAEIEYENLNDDSCYVSFKLNDELNILIWTTTPWTLPANVALAFGNNIEYKIVEINNKKYVVAKELIKKISFDINQEIKELKSFDVKKFINSYAINLLNNEKSKLVYGHHVNLENGTGIVHTAGGHGEEDYLIVKEHNLKLFIVVDENGHMINTNKYNGIFYKKANNLILNDLSKLGALIFSKEINHSVPIDWRTKLPVIYRATKQWFVSIDKIKESLLNDISQVSWLPSWGEKRITNMIKDRDDWCISRQRIWGVPIPIIYNEKNEPIVNKKLQNNIEKLFEEKGILGWREAKIEELLPSELPFKKEYRKETDILDVWFDSGSSHLSALGNKQADIYLEGNDQYRGWFNSSLITSEIINKRSPYKKVITHGFTIDKQGNKMSKSLGNTIDPIEIVNKYGSDILKLWVASSDYFNNLKFSDEILDSIIKDYKKIRNTFKYLLGNIYDYNNDFNKEYSFVGKMILSNLQKLYEEINISYDNFKFVTLVKKIINEITSDSISYYLEYVKDVIYIEKENSDIRREAQSILNYIFEIFIFALAPILPTTIEEVWSNYHLNKNTLFFENTISTFNFEKNDYWEKFNIIREKLNKEIEKLRNEKIINKSVEVEATIIAPESFRELDIINLNNLLMIAKVNLIFYPGKEANIGIKVKKFEGIKCNRCWKYFEKENMIDDICKRCHTVIS